MNNVNYIPTGKRTNFVGWSVAVAGDWGMVLPVVEATAQFCDFCTDPGTVDEPNNQAAEYTVDAVTSLGEGGNDVHYCQEHMRKAVNYGFLTGDIWTAPVEVAA